MLTVPEGCPKDVAAAIGRINGEADVLARFAIMLNDKGIRNCLGTVAHRAIKPESEATKRLQMAIADLNIEGQNLVSPVSLLQMLFGPEQDAQWAMPSRETIVRQAASAAPSLVMIVGAMRKLPRGIRLGSEFIPSRGLLRDCMKVFAFMNASMAASLPAQDS